MASTDIEPRAAIDWSWRPTNQVRAILEGLATAGILAISRRDGNKRVYDLTERLFPADLLACRVPEREQLRHKLLSRFRGNGLLGETGDYSLWAGLGKATDRPALRGELVDAGELVPVEVEGFRRAAVRRRRRGAHPRRRRGGGRGGGAAARTRAWRSSRPSTRSPGTATCCGGCSTSTTSGRSTSRGPKRRHGYYTLPILYGDRIVGPAGSEGGPQGRHARDPRPVVGGRVRPAVRGEPGFVGAFADALRAHMAFLDARTVALPRVGTAARVRGGGAGPPLTVRRRGGERPPARAPPAR